MNAEQSHAPLPTGYYLAIPEETHGRPQVVELYGEFADSNRHWRNHEDDRIGCDPRDIGYRLIPLSAIGTPSADALGAKVTNEMVMMARTVRIPSLNPSGYLHEEDARAVLLAAAREWSGECSCMVDGPDCPVHGSALRQAISDLAAVRERLGEVEGQRDGIAHGMSRQVESLMAECEAARNEAIGCKQVLEPTKYQLAICQRSNDSLMSQIAAEKNMTATYRAERDAALAKLDAAEKRVEEMAGMLREAVVAIDDRFCAKDLKRRIDAALARTSPEAGEGT
jgi:hypothetical protein